MDEVVFDMTKIWGEKMETYYEKLGLYNRRNGLLRKQRVNILEDERFDNLESVIRLSISQHIPISGPVEFKNAEDVISLEAEITVLSDYRSAYTVCKTSPEFPIRLILQEIAKHTFEIEKMHELRFDFFIGSIKEHLKQIDFWKEVLWYITNYKIRHHIKDEILEQIRK